ncbi:MAG: hypothetical protein M1823_001973 [Watsoniomyces obsoletus]|nr:MAG: hypothetical protein M1823_001973 [Watsoniomyces obsoletus]
MATKNVSSINSVGDIPYPLIRGLLAKIESPYQLHKIEQNSPHLVGETDELWIAFIRRDIPDYAEGGKYGEWKKVSGEWWDLYKKLKDELEETRKAQADVLKAKLEDITAAKATRTVKVLDAAAAAALAKRVAPTTPRGSGTMKGVGSSSVAAGGTNGSHPSQGKGSAFLVKARKDLARRAGALTPAMVIAQAQCAARVRAAAATTNGNNNNNNNNGTTGSRPPITSNGTTTTGLMTCRPPPISTIMTCRPPPPPTTTTTSTTAKKATATTKSPTKKGTTTAKSTTTKKTAATTSAKKVPATTVSKTTKRKASSSDLTTEKETEEKERAMKRTKRA